MKNVLIVCMGLAVGLHGTILCGTALGQLGPSCVSCGGTPTTATCYGGLMQGANICYVTSYGCITDGYCGSAGGGGCFVAGTLVDTPSGTVAIEDLRVGDRVLGRSEDGELVVNEVMQTYRTLALSYFIINGEISVTGTHPFLVGGTWVAAQDIRLGDMMTGDDGAPVLVRSVETVDFGLRVFNITVSGNHTFIADRLLVHNKVEPGDG